MISPQDLIRVSANVTDRVQQTHFVHRRWGGSTLFLACCAFSAGEWKCTFGSSNTASPDATQEDQFDWVAASQSPPNILCEILSRAQSSNMGAGRCLVGTMASLLSPFFLASLLVAVVKAEIRCYCNTPTCVTTGYMCKSELGICYSDLLGDYRKHSPPEHGCIDHRPESRSPVLCPDGAAEGPSRDWPMVQCCTEDMCNYNDHPGIPFQTSSDRTDHERQNDWSPVGPDEQLPSSSAIWFRAAVIAVPITGAVILTFLVFVAIRMLRNEDKRHRKRHQILSALHRGYPYSQKTFISVRTQDIEKESTAASSNCVTSSSSFSASETKNSSSSHPNVTLVHWEQCNVTDSIDVI